MAFTARCWPAQAIEGGPPEPAGRPLEPAGDGRPRWMAAAHREVGTEPGVQADSSVAHVAAADPADRGGPHRTRWAGGRSDRAGQRQIFAPSCGLLATPIANVCQPSICRLMLKPLEYNVFSACVTMAWRRADLSQRSRRARRRRDGRRPAQHGPALPLDGPIAGVHNCFRPLWAVTALLRGTGQIPSTVEAVRVFRRKARA
jgi:hypothetical protein